MTKLLLLDKDGTLIQPLGGKKFTSEPWDQEPLAGVKGALQFAVADGWFPVVVSNQGGVAAGHKTLNNAIDEMRFCLGLFPEIKEAFFCPDYEGDICCRVWGKGEEHRIEYTPLSWDVIGLEIRGQFRKPSPGMLKLAASLHSADKALMVGDRPEDEGAALGAEIKFVWASVWRDNPTLIHA